MVPDGCGDCLDCGKDNKESALLFLQKRSQVTAFAADHDGGFITIDQTEIESWSATGDRKWSHPLREVPPNHKLLYYAAWVAPSGEILALAELGFGPYGHDADLLSSRGEFEKVVESAGDEGAPWPTFQDREGNRITTAQWSNGSEIRFFGANGMEWAFGRQPPGSYYDYGYVLRALFDGRGRVIVSANLRGVQDLNGVKYGREGERTTFLFTLSYSGDVISVHQVEVEGDVLDAAPEGYYLLNGMSLHRVSAEGKLLDTRTLPAPAPFPYVLVPNVPALWAQDYNSGRVAIVTGLPECQQSFVVSEFDRSGAEVLTRKFVPDDCLNGFTAAGVGFIDGHLFVGGSFKGTHDFGAGERTAQDGPGFVQQLN